MKILDTLVRGDRTLCVRKTEGKDEWTVSVLPGDYDVEKSVPGGGRTFSSYDAAKAYQVELAKRVVAGDNVPLTNQ